MGRHSKEKGVDILIKAFNELPDIRLDVIGSGELEVQLKKTATKNKSLRCECKIFIPIINGFQK